MDIDTGNASELDTQGTGWFIGFSPWTHGSVNGLRHVAKDQPVTGDASRPKQSDGVTLWVNEFFGLKGDERINKIKVHKVARWVMDQYEVDHRMSSITDEELEVKVKELMPEIWEKHKGKTLVGV